MVDTSFFLDGRWVIKRPCNVEVHLYHLILRSLKRSEGACLYWRSSSQQATISIQGLLGLDATSWSSNRLEAHLTARHHSAGLAAASLGWTGGQHHSSRLRKSSWNHLRSCLAYTLSIRHPQTSLWADQTCIPSSHAHHECLSNIARSQQEGIACAMPTHPKSPSMAAVPRPCHACASCHPGQHFF
jgi:hypothetical protein